MTVTSGPFCAGHAQPVAMRLETMHGESSHPDLLLGLFECPECGHEILRPLDLRPDVKLLTIEIPDRPVGLGAGPFVQS